MKTSALRIAALLLCSIAASAQSQVFTLNVVGYINLSISPGNNLIANQLDDLNGNRLDSVLTNTVINGSTFTKWDSAANAFLPASIYDASSRLWSINYSFDLLEGGLLNSPSPNITTFVGQVDQSYYVVDGAGFNYAAYPTYAPGLHLIACPAPLVANFMNVVGRAPLDGEWVQTLNPLTQIETLTTFNGLSGTWDNGTPSLAVGQSAFFNLVPEPSALALASLGATLAFVARRRSSSRS